MDHAIAPGRTLPGNVAAGSFPGRPAASTLRRRFTAAALLAALAGGDTIASESGAADDTAAVALELAARDEPERLPPQPVREQGDALHEEELSFEGQGETLHGTLLVPDRDGPHPAVVLLGGSGAEPRERNRPLAEAFARNGVAAFIYDKRTQGYSADPTGARSYSLLADDAVAAAELLRRVDAVDADYVGVWGVSEGGWVAPLAANRSGAIAFVVTMSGTGIAPASQVAWSVGRALEHRGIHARSMHRALTERLPRFIVSAEMMGEATYEPVTAIEGLRQPYLALWGDRDTVQPSFESARIIADALRRGGNRSHTLIFLSDTDHNGYPTEDGFTRTSSDFTPGYVETMVEWVGQVARGNPPDSGVEPVPAPASLRAPSPEVVDPSGYDHWYVQFTSLALFAIGFLGYGVVGGWRRMRAWIVRRGTAPPATAAPASVRRYARLVAVAGTALWVCALYYIFSVFIDSTAIGSRDIASVVVAGRTGTWLVLQSASVALVAFGVLLAINVWKSRHRIGRAESARLTLVLVATLAFIPWAVHWQLLVP